MKTEYEREEDMFFSGIVRGTKSRYGFLSIDSGDDIFIKPQEMDKVFPGDIVDVKIENYGKEDQNLEIIKVVKTTFSECVGVYTEDETGAYVLPDNYGFNRKIRIPKAYRKRAKNNQIVKASILEHPFETKKPKAKVEEVIGFKKNLGVEADYCLSKYNINNVFPDSVKDEVAAIVDNYDINKYLGKNKRKNLTKLNFFTIDGENTVDIDDAIFIQKLKNKWKILVAISDVSEFVLEDSAIDLEAYNRLSTVYLLGKTIPMLPHEIAHDICSLKPMEKKLALIADFTISFSGEVLKSSFYEGIIESKAKLNYNEIESILDNSGDFDCNNKEIKEQLNYLNEVFFVLNDSRKENNAIPALRSDFRYYLDHNKQISSIEKIEVKRSYQMIEEIMLLTNRCAAKFISKGNKNQKAIYKKQTGFSFDKEHVINSYLNKLGFSELDIFSNLCNYKKIMRKIEDHENSEDIKQFLNLHLEKSLFSEKPSIHYVMGFNEYTYFTSPIRRYCDIMIHRIIKNKINNKKYSIKKSNFIEHFEKTYLNIDNCAQELESILKNNYLQDYKDNVFSSTIIDFLDDSLKVKLCDNGIEGLIPYKFLNAKDINKRTYTFNIDNTNYSLLDNINVQYFKSLDNRIVILKPKF